MVKVKSTLFNYISGKSGNTVFRQMNGKTFYSIRPDSYNVSQSKKAKESRSNFGLVVKFAKIVNEQPLLKTVWSNAKIKGTTSYHRIIKHNIRFVKENQLSLFNIITPDSNILPAESYSVSDDSILLKMNSNSFQQSDFSIFPFTIAAVVYLFDKKKKISEDNLLFLFSIEFSKTLNKNYDTLKIDIPKNILSHFSGYKNCIIYLAGVLLIPDSNKLRWSSTLAIHFIPLHT